MATGPAAANTNSSSSSSSNVTSSTMSSSSGGGGGGGGSGGGGGGVGGGVGGGGPSAGDAAILEGSSSVYQAWSRSYVELYTIAHEWTIDNFIELDEEATITFKVGAKRRKTGGGGWG